MKNSWKLENRIAVFFFFAASLVLHGALYLVMERAEISWNIKASSALAFLGFPLLKILEMYLLSTLVLWKTEIYFTERWKKVLNCLALVPVAVYFVAAVFCMINACFRAYVISEDAFYGLIFCLQQISSKYDNLFYFAGFLMSISSMALSRKISPSKCSSS